MLKTEGTQDGSPRLVADIWNLEGIPFDLQGRELT